MTGEVNREALRTTTASLRRKLNRLDAVVDKAQGELDAIEMAAGLVDENGRRFDERCLSCKRIDCRCPGGGHEPRQRRG